MSKASEMRPVASLHRLWILMLKETTFEYFPDPPRPPWAGRSKEVLSLGFGFGAAVLWPAQAG